MVRTIYREALTFVCAVFPTVSRGGGSVWMVSALVCQSYTFYRLDASTVHCHYTCVLSARCISLSCSASQLVYLCMHNNTNILQIGFVKPSYCLHILHHTSPIYNTWQDIIIILAVLYDEYCQLVITVRFEYL